LTSWKLETSGGETMVEEGGREVVAFISVLSVSLMKMISSKPYKGLE
jgi:hypothetical protein